MANAPVTSRTGTGMDESGFGAPQRYPQSLAPLPNCPALLWPHHCAVPSPISAHVCAPPAATATTPPRPVTLTGVDELVVVPLPSCPYALLPQHLTVSLVNDAQEWAPPAVSAVA